MTKTMPKIDPVTGSDYGLELSMYMRDYGLSEEDATKLMQAETHEERGRLFYEILDKISDETSDS